MENKMVEIDIATVIDQCGKSLAQIAREMGVSISHISRIRNRRRMPSALVAMQLAAVIGVDVNHLLRALTSGRKVPTRRRVEERRAA